MKINKVWGVLCIVFGVLILLSALTAYLKPGEYVATKAKAMLDQIGVVPNIGLNRIGSFEKETGSYTMETDKYPKLVLVNRAGKINITADPNAKQATIRYEKGVSSALNDSKYALNDIKVSCKTEGDSLQIETDFPSNFKLQSSYVDFDITVPPSEAVDLQTNAGEITTVGLQNTVAVNSNAGKIDINGFKNEAYAHTNAGEIKIVGGEEIHKIDASTNAGAVQVWLPENANLSVDASTNIGAVNTNFPLTVEKRLPGSQVRGNIGTGQDGMVTLKTNTGEIQVNHP